MDRQYKPLKSIRYNNAEMGYGPREVSLTDLNSSPMKEALSLETVPFFIHEKHGTLFVCREADKIQLLEMLTATNYPSVTTLLDVPLYFTWPGKYQSHVFEVKRGEGLVHKMLSILNGEDERNKEIDREFNVMLEKFRAINEELKRSMVEFQSRLEGRQGNL